jgi:hypothetical protein
MYHPKKNEMAIWFIDLWAAEVFATRPRRRKSASNLGRVCSKTDMSTGCSLFAGHRWVSLSIPMDSNGHKLSVCGLPLEIA